MNVRCKLSVFALAVVVFSFGFAQAQQRNKVYRIGYLGPGAVEQAFREALHDLGYTEGKNLIIEHRQGPARLPELAAELTHLKLDCILAVGVGSIRAAKNATSTIPIVMGNASDDPVQHGFVASLARPGGNITGVIDMLPDLGGKRLEVLKEALPRLTRVAHLSPQGTPPGVAHFSAVKAAGQLFGIRVQPIEVDRPGDLEDAFQSARKSGAEAGIVVGVNFFIAHRERILNLQLQNRFPSMHTHVSWAHEGGLMSYTTNQAERYRRAAEYVHRIFNGEKPADLPVERPTKFEFVINLKTAKQIGLTIPPHVLARADRVIR
jgi:putative ABC transport system substrate-binding protein